MDSDTGEASPSPWFVVLLIAAPIVAGGSLFVPFDAGQVHRPGLYPIGAGVLVGSILVLWRQT